MEEGMILDFYLQRSSITAQKLQSFFVLKDLLIRTATCDRIVIFLMFLVILQNSSGLIVKDSLIKQD